MSNKEIVFAEVRQKRYKQPKKSKQKSSAFFIEMGEVSVYTPKERKLHENNWKMVLMKLILVSHKNKVMAKTLLIITISYNGMTNQRSYFSGPNGMIEESMFVHEKATLMVQIFRTTLNKTERLASVPTNINNISNLSSGSTDMIVYVKQQFQTTQQSNETNKSNSATGGTISSLSAAGFAEATATISNTGSSGTSSQKTTTQQVGTDVLILQKQM